MYIGFALEKVQMVGWSNVDFKISTIDHNTYYYCSMFIIPTTGQNPNWNSPVHIAFFKIPTAKIQLIIIPTTDQNPNRNFPVQIAFFIIPTSHNPYKVKSRTQLKSLRTQLKSLPTQLKSLLKFSSLNCISHNPYSLKWVRRTQLKSLQAQLKSLQTQLKSLQTQLKSLQTQLKSLQTQLKSLQRPVKIPTQSSKSLRSQLDQKLVNQNPY